MKEEEIIKKCNYGNPFQVPEGYFERFTEELMQQLPEEAPQETVKISMWQRVKPWLYMAAMFAGIIFSARMFFPATSVDESIQMDMSFLSDNEMFITEEAIDSLVEYAIIDEYLLYRYLTDVE